MCTNFTNYNWWRCWWWWSSTSNNLYKIKFIMRSLKTGIFFFITRGGSGGGGGSCFSRIIIAPLTGGVGGRKYLTNTYYLW